MHVCARGRELESKLNGETESPRRTPPNYRNGFGDEVILNSHQKPHGDDRFYAGNVHHLNLNRQPFLITDDVSYGR